MTTDHRTTAQGVEVFDGRLPTLRFGFEDYGQPRLRCGRCAESLRFSVDEAKAHAVERHGFSGATPG